MANNKTIDARLKPFGLTMKDLTAAELKKARADLRGDGAGGFFASEELIRKSFQKGAKHGK